MRQLFFSIFIFISILLLGITAEAQTNPNKIGLDPTVEIITDYQGKVLDADKIDATYSGDSLTSKRSTFTYQALPLALSSEFNMRPIPPAAMQLHTENDKPGTGYFRGGLGYPITPDLNLYLRGQFLEHSSVNLYINHWSFWGKAPMYNDAEILGNDAKTRAGVMLQHFWKEIAVDARMEYRNRHFIYYGQDTSLLNNANYVQRISDDRYMKDNLSQTFHNIKTAFNFYSIPSSSKATNFNIGGLYHYIGEAAHVNNNHTTSQSLLGLDMRFNRKTGKGHALDFSLNTRACNIYDRDLFSNLVINFVPAYQFNTARAALSAGINVEGVYHNDKFAANIYPQVSFSYKVLGSYLTPYVSANGGTQLNTYEKITDENPYILPGLNVANSRYVLDLNAGIKGSVNTYLSYQFNVGYTTIDSMYFYTNSATHLFDDGMSNGASIGRPLRSNFDVHYDNINRLSFELGVSAKIENFEAMLNAEYFQYNMNNETKPWHLPSVEAGLNLRYTLFDQWILSASGTFRGETPVWLNSDYPVSSTVTPSYVNLGAGVEYRINELTSVYIQGTNLLNNNYQQYYLYYNPGIIVSAGFSIAF